MLKMKSALLLTAAQATKITCPKLVCYPNVIGTPEKPQAHLEKNECFNHQEGLPVEELYVDTCQYQLGQYEELSADNVCDFDQLSGDFAWVEEKTQHLRGDAIYGSPDESQLNKKLTKAYCRDQSSLQKGLNNGRACSDSTQCVSGKC
jgi:hypothetical protein